MNAVKRRKMQKREFLMRRVEENRKALEVENKAEEAVKQKLPVVEVEPTVDAPSVEVSVEAPVAEVKSTKKKKSV